LKPAQANSLGDPISKKKEVSVGVAQVLECLPSKHKALSSTPQYYQEKEFLLRVEYMV
jgi:hypothetical protein